MKVLFIGGRGRSGSTVIEKLLSGVPSAVAVGELSHLFERGLLEDQLCGCGSRFSQCPFWSEVVSRCFGAIDTDTAKSIARWKAAADRFRRIPGWMIQRARPGCGPATDAFRPYAARLYRTIAECAQAAIIVDSSKTPSYGFLLSALRDVELWVLHLVRDSRAVAYSWQRKKERPEVVDREAFMPVFSARQSAYRWVLDNAFTELLGMTCGRYERLRYEDFAADPVGSLQSVLEWVGLGRNSALPWGGDVSRSAPAHTVSGNPIRFARGPLVIREDAEWRHAMAGAEKALVTVLTLPALLRYGYPLVC